MGSSAGPGLTLAGSRGGPADPRQGQNPQPLVGSGREPGLVMPEEKGGRAGGKLSSGRRWPLVGGGWKVKGRLGAGLTQKSLEQERKRSLQGPEQ